MSATPSLPPPSAQAVLLESHLRRLRLPAVLAAYPKLAQAAASPPPASRRSRRSTSTTSA